MSLKQKVRTYIGKLHNGISDFRKGCKTRINLMEDNKGDLLAEQEKVIFEKENK
jgi:hypothetical protein